MALAALPGLFFCFAACVLLVLVSVSAPTWEKIYFLSATSGRSVIHFGVFGFTGSEVHIGYEFPSIDGAKNLNTSVLHNLTKVLILHPIAAGLSGIAFLSGLIGLASHRAGAIVMSLAALLAFLVTLVVWVIDMVLFTIVRHRIRDAENSNGAAEYGNANWMTLGALVALGLGFCLGLCGSFGHYGKKRRNNGY